MNYELAKELKDAGWHEWPETLMGKPISTVHGDADGWYYFPPLSELIEACGDILLFKLPKDNEWDSSEKDVWVASTVEKYLCADTYFIDTNFNGETGSTPEEAVARLWLALNSPTP